MRTANYYLAAFFLFALSLSKPEAAQANNLKVLTSQINRIVKNSGIPGLAVAVVDKNRTLYSKTFRFANLEQRRKVNPDTPFLLASVSKLVTGVAAMKLVEGGSLSLDSDIQSYLPFNVRNPDFEEMPITVRMLMAHTSSILDNYAVMGQLYSIGDSPIALGDFLRDYLVPGMPYYSHGASFSSAKGPLQALTYSNIGIALLGYVVERASAKDFSQYCRDEIFSPLGMSHTAWKLAELDADEVAMPYVIERSGSYVSHIEQGHYGFPDYPNGQLRSSIKDLSIFLRMIIGDGTVDGVRILDSDTVKLIRTVQYADLDDEQGLVGYYERTRSGRLFGHEGEESGVAARMFYRLKDKIGVIVVANTDTDDEAAEEGLMQIEKILFSAFKKR